MHSSDSFTCNNGLNGGGGGGGVPPFLRAYATRRSYSPIGRRRRHDERPAAVVGVRGMFSWKRAVGAAAVFVAFVAAVSTSNSWRVAGGSPGAGNQHLQDKGSSSYRGIFEAFEVECFTAYLQQIAHLSCIAPAVSSLWPSKCIANSAAASASNRCVELLHHPLCSFLSDGRCDGHGCLRDKIYKRLLYAVVQHLS